MQQRQGRQAKGRLPDPRPGLAQIGDVFRQFGIRGVLAIGPEDEAAALLASQALQARAQFVALVLRDFLRHPDVIILRQKDQHASGDADLGREPRALAADRVLDHLHHQCLALEHLFLDWHLRLRAAHRRGRFAIGLAMPDIGHMQEGRALEPDIDKGRLHARQHPGHLAEIDISDQTALKGTLNVQFLHGAVLDDGDPCLLRRPVDQNVFLHRG